MNKISQPLPEEALRELVLDADIDNERAWVPRVGPFIKVDEHGDTVGYEDVFTRLEACKTHYEKVGLGAKYATRLVR